MRVANLLIAVTALSIFAYLVIFYSVSSGGNGGEYWDFDGHVEPHRAAADSFTSGDYELLALDMSDALGKRVRIKPTAIYCKSMTRAMITRIRLNSREALHGQDSLRLAEQFLQIYNRQMIGLMQSAYGFQCEEKCDELTSVA